ncbi:MAG: sugar transferase, partial [Gemmatimonadaceae bacterium]|nr:sugar transferase [Gloeobacterales cyanobacterium ES-bin-141]
MHKRQSRLPSSTDKPDVLSVPLPWPPEIDLHVSRRSLAKRSIDLVGASLGLVIVAALYPLIALAIRLDSPGPILYRHRRVGLGGHLFWMYKFRSMCADAEALQPLVANEQSDPRFFKNKCDPRITRVGAFLRRTSLDEFPQFWNVLTGEMSLVGTRPPLPGEVALYEAHHWRRLAVKPGITGLWQVSGRSSIGDFDRVVELDLAYQKAWSIPFDLLLIARTVRLLFAD